MNEMAKPTEYDPMIAIGFISAANSGLEAELSLV